MANDSTNTPPPETAEEMAQTSGANPTEKSGAPAHASHAVTDPNANAEYIAIVPLGSAYDQSIRGARKPPNEASQKHINKRTKPLDRTPLSADELKAQAGRVRALKRLQNLGQLNEDEQTELTALTTDQNYQSRSR